jgi:hypothetical protein
MKTANGVNSLFLGQSGVGSGNKNVVFLSIGENLRTRLLPGMLLASSLLLTYLASVFPASWGKPCGEHL